MENRMSTTTPNPSSTKSPLDAAQKIILELHGMTPDDQSLAIRFAAETLRLSVPAAPVPSAPLSPHSAQVPASAAISSAGHSTDIRSFTAMKAPKSDQQFAAVVAYYYQFEAPPDQRKESIDVQTMKDAARMAQRRQPPQWIYTLTNAKNAGYLDSVRDGNYKLSPVGENLVAITLPGNGQSSAGGGKKKTAKKTRGPAKKVNKKN